MLLVHAVRMFQGYGPNLAIGATAAVSSSASGSAANTNDGNTGTVWIGGEANAGVTNVSYARIDLGTPRLIGKMIYRAISASGNGFNTSNIQYSDNGSSWTTALSTTFIQADPSVAQEKILNQPTIGPHRYWRILETAQGFSGRVGCAEIEWYEYTA